MRIRQLHIIGEYKNLKKFKLNFDGKSFIDVFVGKNGTGKSNLFEALIEIFRHLFEMDYTISFEYEIIYEIESKQIVINWIKEKLSLNGEEVKIIPKELLPDDIIIYYSGHNTKVTELVLQYEDVFKKNLKEANEGDTREFIGIGKEYKEILLAVLLLQEDGNKAKEFIRQKLGVQTIGNELKIVLKRPYYARKKGYEIDRGDINTSFWRAEGITRNFLEALSSVKSSDTKDRVRDEGYFVREEYADEYILYFDIKDFQRTFSKLTAQQLFREFDNLKTIEMLDDISIDIKLENGPNATTNHFSDGQFQTVYIYSIIELFKDRNCITLLDEPDSFLHPEWQYDFLKQIFEITEKATPTNHILMCSHSAVTLIPHNEKHIKLFHFIGNDLRCHSVNKTYAINLMSSNLMRYSEDEQILSILHSINIEKKPVFFTEGSTDPAILKIAWEKLFKEPMPFIPIMALNCVYLRSLLQDDRIFNELGQRPLFGLFDFDEAYNEWNYLKGERIEKNPYKGLLIDVENKNSYAFMLPIPQIPEIELQVIKNKKTSETYGHNSKMAIEHLFYGDKATHEYFQFETLPGGGKIIEFKEDRKTQFAEEFVIKIDAIHFEVFRPMFEFVKSKCKK